MRSCPNCGHSASAVAVWSRVYKRMQDHVDCTTCGTLTVLEPEQPQNALPVRETLSRGDRVGWPHTGARFVAVQNNTSAKLHYAVSVDGDTLLVVLLDPPHQG